MSYTSDIRRIAKQDEPKKGLSIIQERSVISSGIGKPVDTRQDPMKGPLSLEITLETQTEMEARDNEGKIFQNNDDTSDNWVQVKVAKTALMVDVNGKKFDIKAITFVEP